MRYLAWLLVCVVVGGCATAAEREIQRRENGLQQIEGRMRTCLERISNSAQFQQVKSRGVIWNFKPTLAQLSDSAKPTPDDLRALFDLHEQFISPCRKLILEAAALFTAAQVAAVADWFAQTDAVYVKLAQGNLTWGQAVQALSDSERQMMARSAQIDAEMRRNLAQSHNAEIARRQQAAAALSNYVYQQQVLIQNQQMIDAANRPRVTNCQYVGAYLNCTTY